MSLLMKKAFGLALGLFFLVVGYVAGGYITNYETHNESIDVEVETSFIRLSIAVDTLNTLRNEKTGRAIDIQEDVMCTLVKNISEYDLTPYLKDDFNKRSFDHFNIYTKNFIKEGCP